MLFISVEDFYQKASAVAKLSREEEKQLAKMAVVGDGQARSRLIEGYLPFLAGQIKRLPLDIQTLSTVYSAITALEKGVDSFNFDQDSETFIHHLSWRLRQCFTRCIAEKG